MRAFRSQQASAKRHNEAAKLRVCRALISDLEGERCDRLPHVEGLADRSLRVLLPHFRREVRNAAGKTRHTVTGHAGHRRTSARAAESELQSQSCRFRVRASESKLQSPSQSCRVCLTLTTTFYQLNSRSFVAPRFGPRRVHHPVFYLKSRTSRDKDTKRCHFKETRRVWTGSAVSADQLIH